MAAIAIATDKETQISTITERLMAHSASAWTLRTLRILLDERGVDKNARERFAQKSGFSSWEEFEESALASHFTPEKRAKTYLLCLMLKGTFAL